MVAHGEEESAFVEFLQATPEDRPPPVDIVQAPDEEEFSCVDFLQGPLKEVLSLLRLRQPLMSRSFSRAPWSRGNPLLR